MKANERTKLVAKIKKAGYDVVITGRGHYKVRPTAERVAELKAKGVKVEDFPPFVIMSCSPSKGSSQHNTLRDMKRIGYNG